LTANETLFPELNDFEQEGVASVLVNEVMASDCPLFTVVREGEVKLALPDPFEFTPDAGVCAVPLMEYATVKVADGRSPVKLILAVFPLQTAVWVTEPRLGEGETATFTV
jgi:hypothetical protein